MQIKNSTTGKNVTINQSYSNTKLRSWLSKFSRYGYWSAAQSRDSKRLNLNQALWLLKRAKSMALVFLI